MTAMAMALWYASKFIKFLGLHLHLHFFEFLFSLDHSEDIVAIVHLVSLISNGRDPATFLGSVQFVCMARETLYIVLQVAVHHGPGLNRSWARIASSSS